MDHQPRERAVACSACGAGRYATMTWNNSGLCDRHEQEEAATRRKMEKVDL